MIVRFVKMTFRPEHAAGFEEIFYRTRPGILKFKGCKSVDLFTETGNRNIYFTVSYWDSEADLHEYRSSDFFKATWAGIKPMFAAKAEAWSLISPSSH
ncbi:MAG TPA: antibiotic biosynthesis monooxygenase family protein [Sphingobacteriaceae bacterium]